jgi:hypothetical protein
MMPEGPEKFDSGARCCQSGGRGLRAAARWWCITLFLYRYFQGGDEACLLTWIKQVTWRHDR